MALSQKSTLPLLLCLFWLKRAVSWLQGLRRTTTSTMPRECGREKRQSKKGGGGKCAKSEGKRTTSTKAQIGKWVVQIVFDPFEHNVMENWSKMSTTIHKPLSFSPLSLLLSRPPFPSCCVCVRCFVCFCCGFLLLGEFILSQPTNQPTNQQQQQQQQQ